MHLLFRAAHVVVVANTFHNHCWDGQHTPAPFIIVAGGSIAGPGSGQVFFYGALAIHAKLLR